MQQGRTLARRVAAHVRKAWPGLADASAAPGSCASTSVAAPPPPCAAASALRSLSTEASEQLEHWKFLATQGAVINPCNSPLHPAVQSGLQPADGEVLSVQQAYTPNSKCFGCGQANMNGLQLRSMRIKDGLEANLVVPSKYCAFPGFVNGGIISTIIHCHGNWTAAIALMDKACLPKPPLTLSAQAYITYKYPTPPDTPLVVRSKVIDVREKGNAGMGKTSVEVDVTIYEKCPDGSEKLLVSGAVVCKRLGALRAL
mmetsp:Transcript_16982/g.50903  ORF Transcript_16982/g.50903 Transcript_16982/m.50903 type:complete len:257 (-) Transcript_16982:315-1085(-)